MKKTLLIIALGLAAASNTALACNKGKDVEHRVERMTEHLDLNAQQGEQVRDILQHQRQEARQLRKTHREHMKTLREGTQQKLKGVLTAEQYEQFQARNEARRERWEERCEHPRHHHGGHEG